MSHSDSKTKWWSVLLLHEFKPTKKLYEDTQQNL